MLDGNAIAGTLAEVFDAEMTAATCVCGRCGARFCVGETATYVRAPGVVARCRMCDNVLLVIVERNERYCVDVRGIAAIEEASGTGERIWPATP